MYVFKWNFRLKRAFWVVRNEFQSWRNYLKNFRTLKGLHVVEVTRGAHGIRKVSSTTTDSILDCTVVELMGAPWPWTGSDWLFIREQFQMDGNSIRPSSFATLRAARHESKTLLYEIPWLYQIRSTDDKKYSY